MKDLINKDVIIYIIIFLMIVLYGFGYKIPPLFTTLSEKQNQIKDISTQIIDLEKKKSELSVPKPQVVDKPDIPIEIYKSLYIGKDVENTGMELVYQFLKIVGSTGNKVTEISMTPSGAPASAPAADSSAPPAAPTDTNSPPTESVLPSNNNGIGESSSGNQTPQAPSVSSFGILNVTMTLDCSYVTMQNLLQKITTWQYLSEIKMLGLNPQDGNPNNLQAVLSVDLYVGQ